MEPRPTHQPISAADVQRLHEQLQRPLPLMHFGPVGRYQPERRPAAAELIDGAPVPPEISPEQVAAQLASDEQAWLTRHLVQALVLAGEPATLENVADYGPRLSMRRYPDGVMIVALDSEPAGRTVTLGRQLFGMGEAELQVPRPYTTEAGHASEPGPLQIIRPLLTAEQCLLYELSLKKYPAEAFAYGLGFEDEPEHIDKRLQQLYGRYGYGATRIDPPPYMAVDGGA